MANVTKPSATAPLMTLFGLLLCVTVVNAETVELGACFHHDTNSYRCAMNSAFCRVDYDEKWIKPFNLQVLDGRKLCSCSDAHIGNCSPSHGYRGNCAHEEMACPADNEYFNSQIYFYNDGASCMCHGMVAHPQSTNTIESELTLYGACENGSSGEMRCAVYSKDCSLGERWLSPIELEKSGKKPCSCEKVRTGSCVIGPSTSCAVDSDSCAFDSVFTVAKVTMENGVDCFLCDNSQLGRETAADDNTADDDNKAKSDDDDKAKSDDDDKAKADDDDKDKADDDDKDKADDDDKAKADDDDGVVMMYGRVSKKKFGVALGFMITSLICTFALAVFITIQQQRKKSPNGVTKAADGSVV